MDIKSIIIASVVVAAVGLKSEKHLRAITAVLADMQAVTLLLRRLPKAKRPSMLALLPAKRALKK